MTSQRIERQVDTCWRLVTKISLAVCIKNGGGGGTAYALRDALRDAREGNSDFSANASRATKQYGEGTQSQQISNPGVPPPRKRTIRTKAATMKINDDRKWGLEPWDRVIEWC